MDPVPTVRLTAKHRLCYPSCRAVCGDLTAQVTMMPSLLLANTKQIHLVQNDTNKKCLQLAKKGSLEVSYFQHHDIQLKCSQMFAIDVTVDLVHLAMNTMLSSDEKFLSILDENFSISDVLKVFQIAYDNLSEKISGKINRKLIKYIKVTKRSQQDKKILTLMHEAQKNNEDAMDEQYSNTRKQRGYKNEKVDVVENIRKQSIEEQDNSQNNKRDNYRGNRNNNRNNRNNRNSREPQSWNKKSQEKHYRKPSKEKQIDKRILLGINGDSQDGWRARYRPERIPQSSQKQQKNDNFPRKKEEEQKRSVEIKKEPQTMQTQEVRRQITTNNALKSIFSFPRQGTKFDFSKLQNFMLFINGSFWIKYLGGTLSISKGDQSFARKCELTYLDGNGFMGEGLTLDLEGTSNLQDGGETFGDAKISTFTLSDSQFFHVVTMEVYSLGSL